MGKDKVCLGTDSSAGYCVNSFDFFVVTDEVGLKEFAGLVGLGPINVNNGPSLMQNLIT